MKVYGGLLFRDGRRRQVRVVVEARSQAEARRRIEDQTGSYLSAGEFRSYWSQTWNDAEVQAAADAPGTVLWCADSLGHGSYQPWASEAT